MLLSIWFQKKKKLQKGSANWLSAFCSIFFYRPIVSFLLLNQPHQRRQTGTDNWQIGY